MLDLSGSLAPMTNTTEMPTDAAVSVLLDSLSPAAVTHPLYVGLDVGVDVLETDVHVVASRWVDAGDGVEARALCGETLVDLAHGLVAALPMCSFCAEVLA